MTHVHPSLHRWRDTFPILKNKTYLASHSLGPAPAHTAENLQQYYKEWTEKGIEAWDGPWWQAVVDFCKRIEGIIDAPSGSVVPMENVTRGLQTIASCIDFSSGRNRVLTTRLEFTTLYPFLEGFEKYGAEIELVGSSSLESSPTEELIASIDDKTALVITSHVFFRSGRAQDLQRIAERAHFFGALCVGDGYQAVGTYPVSVTDLGVDFYVGGSHKWLCGGPGAGFLYVAPHRIPVLEPRLRGWFGLRNPFHYESEFLEAQLHSGVFRFLGGTPSVSALYASKAGLEIIGTMLKERGIEGIRFKTRPLSEAVIEEARSLDMRVRSPLSFDERNGMICLDFPRAKQAAQNLCQNGVIVDWRPDCGMRVSVNFYNDFNDIDHFLDELKKCV